MMKRVVLVAVVAAMLGGSAAAEAAGSTRLDMMMQRGPTLSRCGPKGNGAKCVGDACCSKFGFCGTTPYHCDATKGCESQCKDQKSESSEPKPVVPTGTPDKDSVQIVVKTISNAVPLCTDCPKALPAPVEITPAPAADAESSESSEGSEGSEDSEGSEAAAPEPVATDDVPGAATGDADAGAIPDAAAAAAAATTDANADKQSDDPLAKIKQIQAEGIAQAKQIVADAKEAAAKAAQEGAAGAKQKTQTTQLKGPLSEPVDVLEKEGY